MLRGILVALRLLVVFTMALGLLAIISGTLLAQTTPTIFINRISGPVGTAVTVSGSNFSATEGITVTFDGVSVANTTAVSGAWSASFSVPQLASGAAHAIGASGTTTPASSVTTQTFTITPSISLNRLSGSPGTSVSATGLGFATNEIGITVTWDGAPVSSGIQASATGSWSATFNVPASAGGSRSVSASGTTTSSTNVPVITFNVTPAIVTNRTSGSSGTPVIVSGSGFAAGESGITVTYDGTSVVSGITASSTGSWNASFNIPASASGSHTIGAGGGLTMAAFVMPVSFSISPAISISRNTGSPGIPVTVDGSGFGVNETGITVTYDGNPVASGVSASATGSWSTTFNTPPSASGSHTISAYGSTTQASTVTAARFTIGAGISSSRASGTVGTSLTITGTGFSASETGITITYDGTTVNSGISASATGSWSANFNIPASASGAHAISAQGIATTPGTISSISFTINPAMSINRANGSPGTSVTVSGSGFGAGEAGISVTYDGTSVASGVTANASGSWSTTFNVPASPSGSHVIDAQGSSTRPGSVTAVSFTVNPAMSINRANGSPGTSVTVSGSGFGAGEAGISVTYDGNPVASGVTANASGSWSTTFNVPASHSGSHVIDATGASTQRDSVPDLSFTITPGISLSRTSGPPGTSITINGSGFSANETGISVTYDGNPVASGTSASPAGSWSTTFRVPASPSGSHAINASGAATAISSVPAASFITSASIASNKAAGTVGTSITVTGSGFGAGETGITVTYDGNPVASGIAASAAGSWSTTFNAPASTSGSHAFDAYGVSTQADNVANLDFAISPSLSINPASGHVGIKIEVAGTGFAASSRIALTYDGAPIPDVIVTSDAAGSFGLTIAAPKSKGGARIVKATDPARGESQTTFAMDTTPPPLPSLSTPKNSTRIGLLGGITPALRWSGVEDPSGLSYTLQIDTTPEFRDLVLQVTDITTPSYTLPQDKALPRGTYYWRVKAIDAASNETAWTQPFLLTAGLMDLWTLILLIVLGVGMAGGAAYYFFLRRPRWRKAPAVAEGEVVAQPPSVYVRVFKPEETGRLAPTVPPRKLLSQAPSRQQPAEEIPSEEQVRAKMTVEFARSLPLIQPGYNVDWLAELVQLAKGATDRIEVYRQLLLDEPGITYEPAWQKHPLYPDMMHALEGHSLLQDIDAYVDAAGRCASECIALLQDIYHDALAEIPEDVLEQSQGWPFIFAVYADAASWFRGKFLRQPSEGDYLVKTETSDVGRSICWLHGQDNTPFAGPLIQASDDKRAFQCRDLHLGLRRNFRQSDKAKAVVEMIVQLDFQRNKLMKTLSRVDTTFDTN